MSVQRRVVSSCYTAINDWALFLPLYFLSFLCILFSFFFLHFDYLTFAISFLSSFLVCFPSLLSFLSCFLLCFLSSRFLSYFPFFFPSFFTFLLSNLVSLPFLSLLSSFPSPSYLLSSLSFLFLFFYVFISISHPYPFSLFLSTFLPSSLHPSLHYLFPSFLLSFHSQIPRGGKTI